MTVYDLKATFARGELAPRLHARTDIEHYKTGLAACRNWLVMRQGGLRRRPGFKWIAPLRDESEAGRLFEFEFSEEQAYVLIFNGDKIRFATLGGQVTLTAQNITGITKANPAVVTYSGSDTYANGDRVWISGVVGMTEVNNREFTVANVDTGNNTFELSGINSSSYTTYSSGGTVAEIYEVASPYDETEIFDLQIAQVKDTVYIAHPDHAPMKLVRSSETSWALSEVSFKDGPWLDQDTQGTTLTPASTGGITPLMTDNTTPSGTASDSASSADAYKLFNRVVSDADALSSTTVGWFAYDFPSTNTKVADAYWLIASSVPADTPTTWTLDGYTGSAWVVLDSRTGETGWAGGEKRYYEFANETAYQSYRISVAAVDGGSNVQIVELVIHEHGDYQTAFNLTASAVTGINGGTGFQTTDVGRTVRLLGSDGVWRYAVIVSRTSTTVVTVRLYGHALLDTSAVNQWQLSAWSTTDGYPRAVGFFENRLGWGYTDTEPRKVWLSKSGDFENHGLSQPPLDSDGINVAMTGGRFNRVGFIEELADLAVGTPGSMRVLGPNDPSNAFSNTNIRQKQQSTSGAAALQPLIVGSTLIYVGRYRKRIYEYAYSFEANSYAARELSILSEHLFRSGVTECAFQEEPDNIGWFVVEDGFCPALSYEQAQQIAGLTKVIVAGGGSSDAIVESVASIPSTGGDVAYAIAKRTINGATRRYVEYLAPAYETGDDLDDAVYFDAAGQYSGSAVASISGVSWLIGESVGILADGVDVGDATVSATGTLALPSGTASKWSFGKRYTSYGETLRAPQSGNRDGSALGRKMRIVRVWADLLETAGLQVGTQQGTRAIPRGATEGELQTGMSEVIVDDRHSNEGIYVFTTNKGYPATLRALQMAIEGEP